MLYDSFSCVRPEGITLNNPQVPVKESGRLEFSGFSEKYRISEWEPYDIVENLVGIEVLSPKFLYFRDFLDDSKR